MIDKAKPLFCVNEIVVSYDEGWKSTDLVVTVVDERGHEWSCRAFSLTEAVGNAVMDIARARRDEQNQAPPDPKRF